MRQPMGMVNQDLPRRWLTGGWVPVKSPLKEAAAPQARGLSGLSSQGEGRLMQPFEKGGTDPKRSQIGKTTPKRLGDRRRPL